MALRVLHVLDHALPLQSGYVFRSLGILRQQQRMGWQTVQLTAPRQQAGLGQDEVDGWTFHRTGAPTGKFVRLPVISYIAEMRATYARIVEVARAERVDLIHAHSPALNGLPAVWAGRALGLPVVYEVRAFWEDAAADLGRAREGGLRYRGTRALETAVLRRADAITTLCQGTRNDIIARGIPGEKVTIIPNAVDLANFSPTRGVDQRLAEEMGITQCVVFGFIGSFYHYEGLDILIEAFQEISSDRDNIRLLLIGGGPEEDKLKEMIQKLQNTKIIHMSRISHQQIGLYYDLVDVFVYPRRSMRLTNLVTPLKPIEAMAKCRLVVASDVGGHREIISSGVNGMLFAADDPAALRRALLDALAQREAWPALVGAAREYVERERTWEVCAAGYRSVYERLAQRQRPMS